MGSEDHDGPVAGPARLVHCYCDTTGKLMKLAASPAR